MANVGGFVQPTSFVLKHGDGNAGANDPHYQLHGVARPTSWPTSTSLAKGGCGWARVSFEGVGRGRQPARPAPAVIENRRVTTTRKAAQKRGRGLLVAGCSRIREANENRGSTAPEGKSRVGAARLGAATAAKRAQRGSGDATSWLSRAFCHGRSLACTKLER